MGGCNFGWWSVTYHFRVTLTLTSDLVCRKIVSRTYLLYYLRWESLYKSLDTSLDADVSRTIFIPRHTLVSGYYVIPFGVCPSVRPCSPFPIDNLSIYSQNFFKFCIHIVIGDEWYGIVYGQNPSIFNRVTALFRIGKMVSGLLFLYCS